MHEGLNRRLTIGVILSAGGSAFAEVVKATSHLPIDYTVVTDRDCGAEARCAELGVPMTRFLLSDARELSERAAEHFIARRASAVVLHFSRLVSEELYGALPCFNVHPSLLPAFPGIAAVKKARAAGCRFIGATAHLVDGGMDTGAIVAQAAAPVPLGADDAWWDRASFLQKTLVSLVLIELLLRSEVGTGDLPIKGAPPVSPYINPRLRDLRTIQAFQALQHRADVLVFDPIP